MEEIAPRLRSAVPGVRKVGAEDDQELLQDGLGVFAGFTLPDVQDITGFKGRFAEIMPPRPPGDTDATMARQLLQLMEVDPENLGFNPMWN